MSATSSRPCPTPVDTDLPISEDCIKPHAVTEEGCCQPAVSIEQDLAKNMSSTLEQILDVLRGSTIVEERGKDVNSKFWATYKKISSEHDDDFLARANDDMGIILTFAGLFSAVNSTFIIGMQPNPGDTTNALLLHLIQIIADGPNAVDDISNLSSSTDYSSSTVWIQTLAYASLSFSILAAFGAVLAKQWLNSYKAARGRGSLEERGMQRQIKLDGLEYFHLPTILQAFFVLLQISLLLFGLSLSANLWTQQTTISSVIICTTAFGILLYGVTIHVSLWRPDSPFQTPGSKIAGTICRLFLPVRSTMVPNIFTKSSAIRWILETSTNPEVIEAAAAMVPLVQWSPKLDASAAYARLRDNFMACHDSEELYVKYAMAMAHLCSQAVKINPELLGKGFYIVEFGQARNHLIRNSFMAGRLAYHQLESTEPKAARRKHKADARTALRTMAVHGKSNHLSLPDDETLIWDGDLQWWHSDGLMPDYEEFDWLVDYLESYVPARPTNTAEDEIEGDALLALSAMHGLGSSAKRPSYIRVLVRCMGPTRPPRVRHAALRAISDARGELASIINDSVSQGVDATLLDELSRALLTTVRPNHDQAIHHSGPDAFFHKARDGCYFRLIFALAKNDEWHQCLTRDGHLERCISLVDQVLESRSCALTCYLIGIFMRIDPSVKGFPFSPAPERWRTLISATWAFARSFMEPRDYAETLPALVTATRQNLRGSDDGVPSAEVVYLADRVHRVLVELQDRQATLANGQEDALVDAALSSVQGLHDDLRRMTE
ncbi:hypothetical protein DFH29DRAFT_62225 [Suillus ampliporus]|nr:hypothetical protein DFH29DRAFT_62225 [Suillus ampliporus]